jgi:sucrose-6-phosphate hydrolase SacC (GH32 family)
MTIYRAVQKCSLFVVGFALSSVAAAEVNKDQTYRERYRPQYHFSMRKGWINDPNGLVYYDGVYHLFCQHNPQDTKWGPMHWSHATSPDIINWTEKPIALFPDELGTMYSGSAVVDWENTSGLGEKKDLHCSLSTQRRVNKLRNVWRFQTTRGLLGRSIKGTLYSAM